MAARSHYRTDERAFSARNWTRWLLPVSLFLVSLLPRLVALNRYITPDELVWVYRAIQFREAILDGRWAGTLVAGHPGVTTSWLGTLGISLQLLLAPADRASYDWVTRIAYLMPDNVEAFVHLARFLSAGRVAVAVVNSLGVAGAYVLSRRLWGGAAALVIALLLALDPFLAGLAGLFHVDGLSATFVTLALLSLALFVEQGASTPRGAWGWLLFSGVMAGLAGLTKTPTLVLLPIGAMALLWPLFRDRQSPLPARLIRVIVSGAVWGLAAGLTALLLYPALWSAPAEVLATVGGSANRHFDEALRPTFFMGETAFNHGPLFYPVVLLWRLSPVVLLAPLPLLGLWLARRREGRPASHDGALPVLLLLAWAVLFLVAITPAAKKFDRYILPAVPAFLILAGLVWTRWAQQWPRPGRWVAPAVVMAQALFLITHFLYPLAAYNPLVGGSRTAVRVLPIGWGEGISAAGRWLADHEPRLEDRAALAGVAPALAPFFPGHTLVDGLDDPETADYSIVTMGGRQTAAESIESATGALSLVHAIRYAGIDQAWIYRRAAPLPLESAPPLSEPVAFGDRIALTALPERIEGDPLKVPVQWRRLASLGPTDRFTVRLAVTDDLGQVWASLETDLLNEDYFYPPDWLQDDTGLVRYFLELPPATPPGRYQLHVSLIDQQTAGQLPVRTGNSPFQGVAYAGPEVVVERPETVVSASRLQLPEQSGARWLDGRLWLLGHSAVPDPTLAGSDLPVTLFWHAPAGSLPAGMSLRWSLRPADSSADYFIATQLLSRYDTGQWRAGETMEERYRLPIPPDIAAGRYALTVQAVAGDEPVGPAEPLGEVQVNNIDRLYDLPDDIAVPLETCFGGEICLRGMTLEPVTGTPGQPSVLTLVWQAEWEPAEVYTAFTHVVDADGNTVLQADHWPGGLPTDIWDGGQVVIDRIPLNLPRSLAPGTYDLRVGLYVADNGRRLPITAGGEGRRDAIILPLQLTVEPQ